MGNSRQLLIDARDALIFASSCIENISCAEESRFQSCLNDIQEYIDCSPSICGEWKIVPVEPSPSIIAAAALSVMPTASLADIEIARRAAPEVLMKADLYPGCTVDQLALSMSTMVTAYRAMVAAAPNYTQ